MRETATMRERHVPKRYELCNDSHYIFVHNWGELRENNKTIEMKKKQRIIKSLAVFKYCKGFNDTHTISINTDKTLNKLCSNFCR